MKAIFRKSIFIVVVGFLSFLGFTLSADSETSCDANNFIKSNSTKIIKSIFYISCVSTVYWGYIDYELKHEKTFEYLQKVPFFKTFEYRKHIIPDTELLISSAAFIASGLLVFKKYLI